MTINVKSLRDGVAQVVRDIIGSDLNTIRGQSGQIPAIVAGRPKGPKPAFPYAYIDFIGIQRQGYRERDAYSDSNLDEVTELDYVVSFFIQIHAGVENDSPTICEKLRSTFFTTLGDIKVQEYLGTATLLNVSDISFNPSLMSTDYEEISRITLTLSDRSVLTDPTTGVIENINLEGELYQDFDQTDPPLDVKITVP